MAKLGNVLSYDGTNADVPLYDLVKPDGQAGIYVVNGVADVPDGKESTAIHYSIAEYVFVDTTVVTVGTAIGAIAGQWYASDADANLGQFYAVDTKNNAIAPVIPIASGAVASGGSGVCPCECIDNGDMTHDTIETTTKFTCVLPSVTMNHPNGKVNFPGREVTVVYDVGLSYWDLDIGDDLTAVNNDDVDVTASSTLSGTAKFYLTGVDNKTKFQLCISGDIPAPSGS
jgi:hypothetical protein